MPLATNTYYTMNRLLLPDKPRIDLKSRILERPDIVFFYLGVTEMDEHPYYWCMDAVTGEEGLVFDGLAKLLAHADTQALAAWLSEKGYSPISLECPLLELFAFPTRLSESPMSRYFYGQTYLAQNVQTREFFPCPISAILSG